MVESDVPPPSRARDLVIELEVALEAHEYQVGSNLKVARKREVLRATTLRQDEDVQGNSRVRLRRTSAGIERASPRGRRFAKRWAEEAGSRC